MRPFNNTGTKQNWIKKDGESITRETCSSLHQRPSVNHVKKERQHKRFNKNARLKKTVYKKKKLVPYDAKCKYHPLNKGPKQNRRIHSRLRMICVSRFCVVLFQCIFEKKYKNSLMQFFRNEKNMPFTQILFQTQQYWNSKYQAYQAYQYFEFNVRLSYNSCMLKICKHYGLA